MKSLVSDRRGLSLIELLVGVAVLALLVVPLMRLFLTGAGTEVKARSLAKATGTAQSLTEQVQALDASLLLKDAGLLSPAAAFYTKNSTGYAHLGNTASGNGPYYLGLKSFLSGGQSYDALISLDLSDEANQTPVVVGNDLDAILDLTAADGEALTALRTQAADWVEDQNILSLDRLERQITLSIAKSGDDYQVTVVFYYTADISGETEGKEGQILSFIFTKEKAASCKPAPTKADAPLFSAYLFYDAFYRSNLGSQSLTIQNSTGWDARVFLVNTGKEAVPGGFQLKAGYEGQRFSGGEPVNSLVYTNLPPDRVSYTAKATSNGPQKTLDVTGYLVETQSRERKFAVTVSIFEPNSNFTGKPILTVDSTKLSY